MPFLYRIASDGGAIRRWKVGREPLIVGRSERAAVRIPDRGMSGEHFAIARRGDVCLVEDLNSRNGTWVDGRRVRRCILGENARIVAGRTEFSFEPGLTTCIRELARMGGAMAG